MTHVIFLHKMQQPGAYLRILYIYLATKATSDICLFGISKQNVHV